MAATMDHRAPVPRDPENDYTPAAAEMRRAFLRERTGAALGVETITEAQTEEVPDELPPEPLPALASTRLGEGLLIRVGLPEWGRRLDDRQVAQITLNIADMLRRFEPRIRTVIRD